ncbi:hypothetical protein PINS_up012425 [Pythium insidiosum]|nr:hypothetical protein PINS_up012425 [Pythium insidiosum]
MPTLVHGVDISALEGWMVKINNNPSVFGKSVSRRWFRVSFVPAGNDQKLIISYSSNKYVPLPIYLSVCLGEERRREPHISHTATATG